MYDEEDYLMLSGIQHFAFCRRQWAMIHIEQQWAENYRTTAGELMHKKAHDEGSFEKRGNLLIVRGLRIASRELGLSGQCDVVEFHENENGIVLFGYDGNGIRCRSSTNMDRPKKIMPMNCSSAHRQSASRRCFRQGYPKDFCITVRTEGGVRLNLRMPCGLK